MFKKMRKIITPILAGILALSLTGCIPSGNIVGKANFTTIDSNLASQGEIATIDINGGVVATPTGLRFRTTKSSFSVNGTTFITSKFSDVIAFSIPREEFASTRLKGKNVCGRVFATATDGSQISILLITETSEIIDFVFNEFGVILTLDSQLMVITSNNFYWLGYAPAKTLKIGGRNLCGSGA
jgi:hypothetical protein